MLREDRRKQVEAYGEFARVYDLFMSDVDYESWEKYITGLLRDNGISEGLVLELGCGTGSLTTLLSEAGYDMIGVDNSPQMLQEAMEKKGKQDILYLLQDMREFELYGTVRAIISACDCVNYVTEDEDLLQVFRLVNNYLDPEGLFLFDFNTRYKYETVLGEQVIAEDREDCSFIWDNYYDQEEQINEYELTLFVKCRQEENLYRKYQEVHFQRAYTLEEIKTFARITGHDNIHDMDADDLCTVSREISEFTNIRHA